jgi:hypothetical protein
VVIQPPVFRLPFDLGVDGSTGQEGPSSSGALRMWRDGTLVSRVEAQLGD